MGSATTQALSALAQALADTTVDLDTARELFAASRAVAGSSALSGALADSSAAPDARSALVAQVFGSLSEAARGLLQSAVAERWSSAAEFSLGLEELAIRATAKADRGDVEGELFQVARVIAQNPELELALSSTLGDAARKGELIENLLATRAGEGTTLIVSSLVQQLGNRRVRGILSRAMALAAAQRGRTVATVHTATPLTDEQSARLVAALGARYGTEVSLNPVIEPDVVGGIRIHIADDVIDGSISTRLTDLRQRLAG